MCRKALGDNAWFHNWSEWFIPPIDLRQYGLLLTPKGPWLMLNYLTSENAAASGSNLPEAWMALREKAERIANNWRLNYEPFTDHQIRVIDSEKDRDPRVTERELRLAA